MECGGFQSGMIVIHCWNRLLLVCDFDITSTVNTELANANDVLSDQTTATNREQS